MTAVNWDFFGKQSSLNDLTKFILVPPRHSFPFDSISQLLMYVGRSDSVFIGQAFGQCHRSCGQVSQATSVSPVFPVFPKGAAGFCRLDTDWTEVNCSDLREHNNLHLTELDLRDLWEFSVRLVLKSLGRGTGVIQTIRWYWSQYA